MLAFRAVAEGAEGVTPSPSPAPRRRRETMRNNTEIKKTLCCKTSRTMLSTNVYYIFREMARSQVLVVLVGRRARSATNVDEFGPDWQKLADLADSGSN